MIKKYYIYYSLFVVVVCVGIFSLKDYDIGNDMAGFVSNKDKIVIYTKGSCSYCIRLKEVLNDNCLAYSNTDIANDKFMHNDLIARTGAVTVPYVFINDAYVGGYSDFIKYKIRYDCD